MSPLGQGCGFEGQTCMVPPKPSFETHAGLGAGSIMSYLAVAFPLESGCRHSRCPVLAVDCTRKEMAKPAWIARTEGHATDQRRAMRRPNVADKRTRLRRPILTRGCTDRGKRRFALLYSHQLPAKVQALLDASSCHERGQLINHIVVRDADIPNRWTWHVDGNEYLEDSERVKFVLRSPILASARVHCHL